MHVCMTGHSRADGEHALLTARSWRSCGRRRATCRPTSGCRTWPATCSRATSRGGFLGAAYGPLRVGTDLDNPGGARLPLHRVRPAAGRARRAAAAARSGCWTSVDRARPAAMRRFQERAVDLVTGPEARRAFDLEREPAPVRDRYGRHPLGQNLLHGAAADRGGGAAGERDGLDGTAAGREVPQRADVGHARQRGGPGQHLRHRRTSASAGRCRDWTRRCRRCWKTWRCAACWRTRWWCWSASSAAARRSASAGRDHWPACYSALLAGAGIRGGQVYGASDKHGRLRPRQPGVAGETSGRRCFTRWACRRRRGWGRTGSPTRPAAGQPVAALFG